MTSFKFWLVSGAASDENVSSIVAPNDSSLVSQLTTALSVASPVVHHGTSFRMIDSFGVYVIGRVYRTDVDKFESIVARYWNQSASLVSYQNLRVNIVLQDTYRLTDGLVNYLLRLFLPLVFGYFVVLNDELSHFINLIVFKFFFFSCLSMCF